MKTVILCGGRGTRAYPHTLEVPKPLLEVAARPVLSHLMDIYASQGFTEFVLAGGYKLDMIESFARELPACWTVDVVDTGLDTQTGERIRRCAGYVGECFFATYADGLGDVNLADLLTTHQGHQGLATMTTVPLPSQYGTIEVDDDGRVGSFREKPRLPDHLINAGFFAFDSGVFEHWQGEDLEGEVLPALGKEGVLYAYRHAGFWKSMDTYKDAQDLANLCADGPGPWMTPVK